METASRMYVRSYRLLMVEKNEETPNIRHNANPKLNQKLDTPVRLWKHTLLSLIFNFVWLYLSKTV